MKNLAFLLALNFLTINAFAQNQQTSPPETNDPEAKKILDKIRKKYDAWKSVEVAFTLNIELPGEEKTSQKGSVAQQGEKFRLDMDDQVIISDGKSTWVWLKKSNEVQINNADPNDDNGFLTPKDLLKRYQKGDFIYAVTDKTTENGKVLTQIEFKPKDKKSEYSKIRLSVDAKTNTIEGIKAFAKDGGRYAFKITRTSPDKKFDAAFFTFDKSKFPGTKVEDLRM